MLNRKQTIGSIFITIATRLILKAGMNEPYPAHMSGYIHPPSWVTYLERHPGYADYKPTKSLYANGAKWGTWVTFPQKIEAIQWRVGAMQKATDLFISKDFLAIYKHPTYYTSSVLDYLADPNYTIKQKEIALYAVSQHLLLKEYYQLYRKGKINLELLESAFSINLVNFLVKHQKGIAFEHPLQTSRLVQQDFLKEVIQNLPSTSCLSNCLKALLDDVLPQSWNEKVIYSDIYFGSSQGYYEELLPFSEVIRLAAREKKVTESMKLGGKFHGVEIPPYFLLLLEHPGYYYRSCFGAFSDINDGVHVLRDAGYSFEEKSIAILGMSQLGIQCEYEVEDYAFFIEQACVWYRQGQLSLEHLYQLFKCDFPTFYKYPFFILAYKNKAVQEALATFIAVPTIPEGLKAIARKAKNGTLATKEEIAYMEGYREFRKNHFTLYETMPPR